MKYAKGIAWIDDCRIPYIQEDVPSSGRRTSNFFEQEFTALGNGSCDYTANVNGRFVPNLLVCDDVLNDGIKPNEGYRSKSKVRGFGGFGGGNQEYFGKGEFLDVDSKSRYYDLDIWFEKMLDKL
jgi:hypothetical protein